MKGATSFAPGWVALAGNPGVESARRPVKRESAPSALATLVGRAQKGDEGAWRELIGLYQNRIAGFVYAIVGRDAMVEDLTQQVFVKLVRNLNQLHSLSTFEPWLFRMARNTCFDHLRRQKLRRIFLPLEVEHYERPAPVDGVSTEESDALKHALEQLNPRARALVAMVQQGLSHAEIAEITGTTVSAVKSRLHRARTNLLEHYQAR